MLFFRFCWRHGEQTVIISPRPRDPKTAFARGYSVRVLASTELRASAGVERSLLDTPGPQM